MEELKNALPEVISRQINDNDAFNTSINDVYTSFGANRLLLCINTESYTHVINDENGNNLMNEFVNPVVHTRDFVSLIILGNGNARKQTRVYINRAKAAILAKILNGFVEQKLNNMRRQWLEANIVDECRLLTDRLFN
jgi:hypothetical protein